MPAPDPALPPASSARPRASLVGSFVEGWRRAFRAPWVMAGLLAAGAMFLLPLASVAETQPAEAPRLAYALADEISKALGLDGVLGLVGHAAVAESVTLLTLGAMAGTIAVSLFLTGGVLDRLARGRPVGSAAFFAACGGYGPRLVRLAAIAAVAVATLLAALRPVLGAAVSGRIDVLGAAHDSFVLRSGLSMLLVAGFSLVGTLVDFSLVRLVVEDRYSAFGAIAASLRFVRRRLVRTLGLYLLNVLAIAAIEAVWIWASPAGAPAWYRHPLDAVFVVVKTMGRVAFLASETVFFQGELAHAHYTAAPAAAWPDSPAAEAIANLTTRSERMDPA